MQKDMVNTMLRLSPATRRKLDKAVKSSGLNMTAFTEAVFAKRSAELALDPDVIAHGAKIQAARAVRRRN